MQSFLHDLMNDHGMDHENVWIVEDNARSLRYSDRLMALNKLSEDDRDKRFQLGSKQRSDSAIPSKVEPANRWNPLRRSSGGAQYSSQRSAAIEPLQRNWTENPDSSLCCPVRRVSHEFTSLEATLNALEFSSGEFTSGEFSSGEFSSDMETILEDPFGSSNQ